MIITRTPFRISLFGGGSDYPAWYLKNGGAVLNATINHYCHVSVRPLPPFFEHKFRLVWSQIENVQTLEQLQHPIARECLKYMDVVEGLEIHHDGDLPARGGLGASSAFAVGLLNALHIMKGQELPKLDLGLEAIHVERDLVHVNVGSQDQLACAIGGLNLIEFSGEKPKVTNIPTEKAKNLQEYLMLVFTGFPHDASQIAGTYNFNKNIEIRELHLMALEASRILLNGDVLDIGRMLHESWKLKKRLSDKISTPYVDYIYDRAHKAGAIGGKLCGAGGGGFMLLFVEPNKQAKVKKNLDGILIVPFEIEDNGTQILVRNGA